MRREEVIMPRGRGDTDLPFDLDEDGFPLVHKLKTRIDDLGHRLDYLERRFNPTQYGDGRARILGEIHGLKAAILVMRYHELEVGGELSVITALERVIQAHDMPVSANRTKAQAEAMAMAKHVWGELTRER